VTVTDPLDAVSSITIPPNAPIGAANVVISTLSSNGVTYSENLRGAFTITPTDWSVTPASGEQGQTLDVAITGDGFINGATTGNFGPDIVVKTVTVTDSMDAVASIAIPLKARVGAVNVVISTVSNGATYSYKLGAAFTINPTIWSITPATGEQGQTLNVAITGGGFINGVTTAKFGPNIVVNTVTVTDSLDAIANITIPSHAPTGSVPVTISTVINGTNFVYNLKNGFIVTP
jgi:hypothetical protein